MRKLYAALLLVLCLCGCSKQPAEQPIGIWEGTITIDGAGIEEICYEGLLFITKDGEKIHITATDAVRSNFNEWY